MSYEDEIQTKLEEIREKVRAPLAELAEKQVALQTDLLDVQQKLLRLSKGGSFNGPDNGPSLGSLVEQEFAANAEVFSKGRSLTLKVKAITSAVGGTVASGGAPMAPARVSTQVASILVPGALNDARALTYARRTGVSGGAAVQAGEGAAKAAAEPVFTAVTQNAITIAGVATISEQALRTVGQLAQAVDSHLSKSVRDSLDTVLMDGTAETAWPFTGFEALATAYAAPDGITSLADTIIAGITAMRLTGFSPDVVVMTGDDWIAIQTAKATGGSEEYLSGGYGAPVANTFSGLRVALSSTIAAGKALLMDSAYAGYLAGGDVSVTMGYVNDNFSKNLVTMRGEQEVIPFFTDYQAMRLLTPDTP